MEKIAIIVDSGLNIPPQFVAENDIFVLPLNIIYKDRVYRDGVDITADEVSRLLKQEVPSTSLPSFGQIGEMFELVSSLGFRQILCITISSGLSGTYNAMKISAEEQTDLDIRMIDTKNVSIGSALLGMYARKLILEGASLDELEDKLSKNTKNSKVFFMVDTLEYLRKGGRIGLVSSFIGTKLNLKPIISCNEAGIYYTVSKARGRTAAVAMLQKIATDFAKTGKAYTLGMTQFGAKDEFEPFCKELLALLPDSTSSFTVEVSPSLGIHTGPGTLGIAVFIEE